MEEKNKRTKRAKISRFRMSRAFLVLLLFFLGVIIGTFIFYKKCPSKYIPIAQIINDQSLTQMYSYDGRTKGPAWVMQVVRPHTKENLFDVKFSEDKNIPPIIRSTFADYQNSGFDMAPLLNVLYEGKFPISTASPQLPQFNRIYWSKVDRYVKSLSSKSPQLLVISGPLYLPHSEKDGRKYVTYRVIGDNNVAVPTHFFKAIFYSIPPTKENDSSYSSEVYVIPNEDVKEEVPLDHFKATVEELEKKSGIVFPTGSSIRSFLRTDPPISAIKKI